MATLRVINNLLSGEIQEFSVNKDSTIENIVRDYTSENTYKNTFIECYDVIDDRTYYEPIETNDNNISLTSIFEMNQNGKTRLLQ